MQFIIFIFIPLLVIVITTKKMNKIREQWEKEEKEFENETFYSHTHYRLDSFKSFMWVIIIFFILAKLLVFYT